MLNYFTRNKLFVALCLLTLTASESSYAAEAAAVKKSDDCNGTKSEGEELIDYVHQYISDALCEPAAWFDSFFASDRMDEEVRPGSRVRWSNDFKFSEGGEFEYTTKVRASVRLPKATERLKLVIEGEEEDTLEEVVPTTNEEVKSDLGLLYEFFQSPRANISMRLNLSPKISMRYRYKYPFTEDFLARYTMEFFQTDDDSGTVSRLDFEKHISEPLLLRWTNQVEDTVLIAGNKWNSALVLFQKLSDRSALSYESSVTGYTIPETYNSNARLAVRYRRNFYRKWLYYELVPEITWPKETITDERQQIAAFIFRLEINFINM